MLMPMSRAVWVSIRDGASMQAVLLERKRRSVDPNILCAKLVWCCLVIALVPLFKEPRFLLTRTIAQLRRVGCAIYHIEKLVRLTIGVHA
jgi:endonuclease/exonuclease/phosphatase (EEP) superfamily protein YafD